MAGQKPKKKHKPPSPELRKKRSEIGRRGAEARWRKMLNWHKWVVEYRTQTGRPLFGNWRDNLANVRLRAALLWRVVGRPRNGRGYHVGEVSIHWPPEALDDLSNLGYACDVGLSVDVVITLAGMKGQGPPWKHVRWTWEGLYKVARVVAGTEEEAEMRKRFPTRDAPSLVKLRKRSTRREAVRIAWTAIRKDKNVISPSIDDVRAWVLREYELALGKGTVRMELHTLGLKKIKNPNKTR